MEKVFQGIPILHVAMVAWGKVARLVWRKTMIPSAAGGI
jgi:hypothetical protein